MALGGCLTCIKYLMFVFNFIFWLVGCVILSFGIWILVESVDPHTFNIPGSDNETVERFSKVFGYIFITIGSIIMVVGFAGCCGAIRESQCLLATFFVFLFIIFSILITIGVYAIIYNSKLEDTFKKPDEQSVLKELKDLVANYGNASNKEVMDKYQKNFQCCGYEKGLADYQSYSDKASAAVTCSINNTTPCTGPVLKDKLDNSFIKIKNQSLIAAGVAIGMGIVMLLGMIFSMMLCCAIRDTEG